MSDKKTEKKPLVPRLRFPEFQDSGEWEIKRLGEISKIITEKAGKKKLMLLSVTAGVGLISQIEKFGREIAGSQYKNYFMIKTNDFAYNKSATKEYPQGFIALYTGKDDAAVPNSIFTCFRVNTQNTVPQYLNFLFENNLHGTWLKHFITVGARAHGSLNIDNADLLKTPIPLPRGRHARIEQKKIAASLSSLDELINSECNRLDSIKTHKKGLMQQLFPCAGGNVPRLRFDKLNPDLPWPVSALGDFIEEFSAKSVKQDEYEVLTSSRNGLVRQRDYYDNTRITERDNLGFNIIPPNYLTYRSRSDDRLFFFNENMLGITGIISTYYPVFKISGGSNQFFIALLSHYSMVIGAYSVGTSQTVLSLNELRRIKLCIPNEREQQKIADCLSSLDELISAQGRKIELLKLQKKGLMQQLFPEMDEVTA